MTKALKKSHKLSAAKCLIKVKKKQCKYSVQSILLNVGSKKIVISQNRSN